MTILRRIFGISTMRRSPLAAGLLLCAFNAGADQGSAAVFPVRNQNPFLQIFGAPLFQSAELVTEGSTRFDISLDLANHADAGDSALEDFAIDGESYFLTASFRRRVSERLELGIDVPLIAHASGFLDNAIESWHDAFGMSNTKRRGASNQLGFRYTNGGSAEYTLNSPVSGIGDLQLTAAMPLKSTGRGDDFSLAIRGSVKLPTGDADELRGSGAVDVSLGLYASDTRALWQRDLHISGFAGMLLLGDGDVLAEIQRSAVPFGGAAATWWITENFGATTQLYVQGKYFDSALEELGGNSAQLAVGADFRLPRRGFSLLFAVVEDVSANATTDFALHFSIRTSGAR